MKQVRMIIISKTFITLFIKVSNVVKGLCNKIYKDRKLRVKLERDHFKYKLKESTGPYQREIYFHVESDNG